MTEPSLKKDKDHSPRRLHIIPAASVQESFTQDPLRWWTTHSVRPGEINLHEFAHGVSESQLYKRRNLTTGFSPRPELIAELAPYIKICSANAPIATVQNINPSLRCWWRIFDECDEIAPVRTLKDLNEIHNAAFLRKGSGSYKHFRSVMTFIRVARHELDLPPLYWNAPQRPAPMKGVVNQRTVSLIYHCLKRRCFEVLQRYSDEPARRPSRSDITDAFMLFLLRTGWNVQTALDIDVTVDRDGTLSCLSPHPTSRDHHIVTSRKARAQGRDQFALGANKSQLACGNLLQALVNQSAGLRTSLSVDLVGLTVQLSSVHPADRDTLVARIKNMKAMIRSPWLFEKSPRPSSPSEISHLTSSFASTVGSRYMAAITRAVNESLQPSAKKIKRIAISDLRDAYIEAQYERSGYSWLTAMLAAQHGSIDSVAVYLRKRQYKAHSEKRFLSVTEKMWESVIHRKAIDPTWIAGKLEGATATQLTRWQEGKDRTRVGMGCRDFYNPPKATSPSHVTGTGCRTQRCTLCPNGIVFTDSLKHIARRVEELLHIQSSISVMSWSQSTFPEEMETALKILQEVFEAATVRTWRAYWSEQIRNGSLLPLSIEGVYE